METEGVLQLLLDKMAKECRPKGQDWQILRQAPSAKSHQSNGAAENAVSTVLGLAGTSGSSQRHIPVLRSDNTLSDASVDDQTCSMDSHSIQFEKRHE